MFTYNILDISDDELDKVVSAYKFGNESFFLNGTKYWLNNLFDIQIYSFEHTQIKTKKDLLEYCNKNRLLSRGYCSKDYISTNILEKYGTLKTNDFIKDDFGYLKDNRIDEKNHEVYVDLTRIDELFNIQDKNFDLTKLIVLLKELNVAYTNNCFLSIPILVRTIIDHIPPLFEKTTFAEVRGGYGEKSFKESMNKLESCRKIADSILHFPIRSKESLPTRTQINFSADLDVLLQEIIRINK